MILGSDLSEPDITSVIKYLEDASFCHSIYGGYLIRISDYAASKLTYKPESKQHFLNHGIGIRYFYNLDDNEIKKIRIGPRLDARDYVRG